MAAVPIIATKQPITPSIPIARGWITRLMMSAYKICDCSHFEFCLHFEFYFYLFSIYLQPKHDLFCALGTLWCRFLDNTLTLSSFHVIILKNFDTGKLTIVYCHCTCHRHTLVFSIRKAWPLPIGARKIDRLPKASIAELLVTKQDPNSCDWVG